MLTDTHCHLASHHFSPDEIESLVARAAAAGVHRLITISTTLGDIPRNLALTSRFPGIFACTGIHPCNVHETPDDFLPALREFARHPKVAAIGETGLDYFHPAPEGWTGESYHERQREFLRQHFSLAAELGLNIVIHTRDRNGDQSFTDALRIYEPFAEKVRAVFHCFPGPASQASRVLTLGGLVSFTGLVTFKNAADVLDAVVACPASSFMIETDSPYLAPVPHRGHRCEPSFVHDTATVIASARGESMEVLTAHTEDTAKAFFRLNF